MKKITLALATTIALITLTQILSCKKKETKTMVGNWSSVDFFTKETTNGVVTSQGTISFPGLLAISFNKDNTYRRYSPLAPEESENGTYLTNGKMLILNYTDAGKAMSDTTEFEFNEDSFKTTDITTEVIGSETIVTEERISFKRS
jgi:hypothetical protein